MESLRTAATVPTNVSLDPSACTYNNYNTLATLLNVEGEFECLGPEKSELGNMQAPPQITVSLYVNTHTYINVYIALKNEKTETFTSFSKHLPITSVLIVQIKISYGYVQLSLNYIQAYL